MKTFTMKIKFLPGLIISLLILLGTTNAQNFSFSDSWEKEGFTLKQMSDNKIDINYSVQSFTLQDVDVKGETMKSVQMANHFLPNDAGAPDLPGNGQYIAIPQGAKVSFEVVNSRIERYENIDVAPAFEIPKDNENEPLKFEKDKRIYESNRFYPSKFIKLSEPSKIRGVDVVMLGITPFQYNPITKELIVYRDLEVSVTIEGGNGQYGEERLRSRFWDPMIKDLVINPAVLPEIDYAKRLNNARRESGYEYLIVIPDNAAWHTWANTLKEFRIQQGILTGVVTTDEIGGNNTNTLEDYFDDAYNNWDIPPAAVLLMADYGNAGNSITSPVWDGYCISDHIYADVDGDDQAEMAFARMTAQNEDQLELMVNKVIDFETNPPTSENYYNNPITALGWQTERWFQICSEAVGGYFKNAQGKEPVRINAIYQGNPNNDPWSTAPNTNMILSTFGPDGLGYIPESPSDLGGWTGGNATMVNNAINSGAFLLQHRDHGGQTGWGEPDYGNSDLAGLSNEDLLTFVFSINCLTGKFNIGGECFAEAFHRHEYGVYGIIAATEVSYSFVNDTYVWGLFDHMWPDFLPEFETEPETRGLYPAFGNIAGKYFLEQSNWPYNTGNKEVTYYLFHHHGCAFSEIYSEIPQNLTVVHDDVLLAGLDYFTVTADEEATIALTVDDQIIGLAEGTGAPVDISIDPQQPPTYVTLTVTKTNHFRYTAQLQVIPPNGPYIVKESHSFNDQNGNNQIDYAEEIMLAIGMKNVGTENAEDVIVNISSDDEYVSIVDGTENYGVIEPQGSVSVEDAFTILVSNDVPNDYEFTIDVTAEAGSDTWESSLGLTAYAPILSYVEYSISDPNGNNNGKLDPGETADVVVKVGNIGSSDILGVDGTLNSTDQYITINENQMTYGEIAAGDNTTQNFSISVSPMAPTGHEANFGFNINSTSGHSGNGNFSAIIGQIPVLVIDLDGNNNSASRIRTALIDLEITYDYATDFPQTDLALYNSIFVCLGVYNVGGNHVLTQTEGDYLANYLESGGNLYMEGADTWFYDDKTAVHDYFFINGINDGGSDLGNIEGQDGTLAEGMDFTYSGDNNYIDRLEATGSANVIFENTSASPSYNCAISYDGDTYKTIGSSFEYGGLEDGDFTKEDLMEKYLEFFGFTGKPEAPGIPQGQNDVCNTDEQLEYVIDKVENADYYIWMIEPAEAGTVNGSDTCAYIDWNPEFAGVAEIMVCAMNASGAGPFGEGMDVVIRQAPTAVISTGTVDICNGEEVELSATLTGEGPWTIELNDGSIHTSNSANWTHSMMITESAEFSIVSVEDSYCSNTGEGTLTVNVLPNPVFSLGQDTSFCYYHTITITAPDGYEAYEWYDGSTGMSVVIDSTGVGMSGSKDVWLTVTDDNGCQGTDHMEVMVKECTGIDETEANQFVNIFPNPAEDIIYLKALKEIRGEVNIEIIDCFGKQVYKRDNIDLQKNSNEILYLNDLQNGVYFLIFDNENLHFNKKVVIQK